MIGTLLAVFFVGFAGAFIGSIVGSGGLLTIPFLIFLGLPAQMAVATTKFGAVGLSSGAFINYSRAKHIRWEYVLTFSSIALVSALIGSRMLVAIDKELLSKSIGAIILILLPFVFLNKEYGIKRRDAISKPVGYVLYFLAMIWSAFFGGGGGTLVFHVLISFFGFTLLEATATNKIPWLLMSLIALFVYAANGLIHYTYGISLLFGMFAGGYFGSRAAIKKGNAWIRVLFIAVVAGSALKLLF